MEEPPTTIDEYILTFPADVQPTLREVRRRMRDVLPGVEETISYGIPTFALDGRSVVYFAGWTHHISVYPVPAGDADFLRIIEPYQAGKGTLKFPLADPIPYDVIDEVASRLLRERRARP